jgi:hypothetical protein
LRFEKLFFVLILTKQQRWQINFLKSARSEVKIRQKPPSRIDQIRQKSASIRVVFVGCLVRILPYLRSGPGKIFISFENLLHKIILNQILFLCKKREKNMFFC